MPGAGPSVSPPPGAEQAVPSLCTAGLLSSHSGVFVFYVIAVFGEPLADSVALEIEVHGFVVMPLTFFRRMVGHRLGTPRASVEHARPCACHVLSPDVTRGARRSGQGRSFAGASGFLPDVSRRGPRLLWSVQPGPAGLWLSSRRVFLAACPAAPRHQLPAAPAPPSAPRPAVPVLGVPVSVPAVVWGSNEPCSAWNPRPGAVAAVCVARCLRARVHGLRGPNE